MRDTMKTRRSIGFILLIWALLAVCMLTSCAYGSYGPAVVSAESSSLSVESSRLSIESGGSGLEDDGAEITGSETPGPQDGAAREAISETGQYSGKEEVALYLHTYCHLPDNYITKKEAQELGWDSRAGNLWEIAPGKSIGGSHFGNYEGQLPEKKGRKYFECDIDYDGGRRNAKRIIYSNDGMIFYTDDHYKTFELLYEPEHLDAAQAAK